MSFEMNDSMRFLIADCLIDILSICYPGAGFDIQFLKSTIRIPELTKLLDDLSSGAPIKSEDVDAAIDCFAGALDSRTSSLSMPVEYRMAEKVQNKRNSESVKAYLKDKLRSEGKLDEGMRLTTRL